MEVFYVCMIVGGVVGFILVLIHRWLMSARHNARSQKAVDVALLSRMKMAEVKAICKDSMPSWVSFPDFERVHFLNKILKELWPFINKATSTVIRETVGPILESYKPAGVESLGFAKLTLGDVSPQVAGIRFVKVDDSRVILDIDFKWGGDPSIIVALGTAIVDLPVQLKSLKVFATARIILELTGKIPCIGAVVASLLAKPKPLVGYTLKAVGGSLTALPGVATLIDDVVQGILGDTVVWPKRIVVPLIAGFDTSHLELKIEGQLKVTVLRAEGLKNVDLVGKSDPYVVLWTRTGKTFKKMTRVITDDLNPEWNQSFELEVEEVNSARVNFKIWDEGLMLDQPLGECYFDLNRLKPNTPVEVAIWVLPLMDKGHLPLTQDHGQGKLFVRLEYRAYTKEEQDAVMAKEKAILEAKKPPPKPDASAPKENGTADARGVAESKSTAGASSSRSTAENGQLLYSRENESAHTV
eukprot:TRINITY_DN38732_c0_g1_i1.p1 TRINITY_DN38732_c0_g1~~TRINITY_DN38732_c0_g1_i1.p1  ORF type:complete len:470 (-),score=85.46 TRINITY_DN38732_c0_g1_i1:1786-3195(-)